MSKPVADRLVGLSDSEKRELLARLLKERAGRCDDAAPIEFPLSAGQQGLWYAYQRDPNLTAYNVSLPSRFRSKVDLNAMKQSIEAMVRRHSCLRTVFDQSKSTHEPVQRIDDSLSPEFRIIETPDADETELIDLARREIARPFDLTEGPLLRVTALRIADDDVIVIATTHHIVVDFWSLVLMMDEIRQLYPAYANGQQPTMPTAPSNYSRFVSDQAALTEGDRGIAMAQYWRHHLSGVRTVLDWTTDFERPKKFTHRASVAKLNFPAMMGARINAAARQFGVTGNVVVMALLQVLVGRFANQDSFSIGTPFSGRSERGFEKTVGFFVNLLPITADLSSNPTLEQLVVSVGKTMVDALGNEALPFAEIVRQSDVARDPSRHPLFQVSCTFEKAQLKSEVGRAGFLLGGKQTFDDFAGLRQESFYVEHETCHYDVEFVFEFEEDELRGMICYCRDLFREDTIESMAEQFVAICDQLIDQPNLSVKEFRWANLPAVMENGPGTDTATLCDLLRDSDHGIIVAAKRFASRLIKRGAEPGALIPVCMNRGPDAWVGVLGVMFAGATPIPIDSDQPAVSPGVLRDDATIDLIVAEPDHRSAREFGAAVVSVSECSADQDSVVHACHADDLAYVIYTSGSTGNPKGVMVRHASIANTLRWRSKSVTLTPDDRVLVLLSHQFDAAMAIVLSTLHQNATPVWPRENDLELDALIDQIIRDQITILPAIPSVVRALAAHPRFSLCTSIRQIWCGGETMPSDLPSIVRSKLDCKIWNFYGPTEASVEVTGMDVTQCDARRRIPIGHEIDGVQIHIVDDRLAPLPLGFTGQIAVSGRGLADGYLNRPDLTEQAFVLAEQIRDPFGEPVRVYLTGDLGRRRGDGAIEFLSRVDDQVKVRGYRVELEEVQRSIERIPEVRRAAVIVEKSGTAGEHLAAFVEVTDRFQMASLNQHLSVSLPPFKRPSLVTLLDRIPIGTSGKVDRSRLPKPNGLPENMAGRRQPRSEWERFLEARFSRALEIDSLGIDTNFFEAGGTSLQAAVLTSELSGELSFSIPTSLLFDLGDVRSVADRLVALHRPALSERFGDLSIHDANPDRSGGAIDPLLAELHPNGAGTPVFMIHPPGGIVVCYRELAASLSDDQPLFAIRSRGLHGDETLPETLGEMAAEYVRSIQQQQPTGPYVVGGWSLGGVIAFEVARQLIECGAQVAGLILMDSTVPERSDPDATSAGMEYGIELSLAELNQLSAGEQLPYLYEHAERLGVLDEDTPKAVVQKVIEDLQRLFGHHVQLCQDYQLMPIDVPMLLIRPRDVPGQVDARSDRGWGPWTREVSVCIVSGHHHSMVQSSGADEMAVHIERFIDAET